MSMAMPRSQYQYSHAIDLFSRVVDPLLVLLSTLALLWTGALRPPELAKILAIFGSLLTAFMFHGFDLYRSWRGRSFISEAKNLLAAWFTVLICFNALILLLSNQEQLGLLWPFGLLKTGIFWIWAGTCFTSMLLVRIVVRLFLRHMRSLGKNLRRVLIIGGGDLGGQVCEMFGQSPWLGYDVVGILDDDEAKHSTSVMGVPVIGDLDDAPRLLRERKVDIVFIAVPLRHESRIRRLIETMGDFTCDVFLVPDFYNYQLLNLAVTEIAGLPVMNLNSSPFVGLKALLKWLEDKLLSLLILVLISPVMLLIAIAVKCTSPGPMIFKQQRFGLNGEPIIVYKFRSMTVCEDGKISQATKCDPRVTKVGAFLRRTSLDELPQFINVLQGRMSIVGPRPHAIYHNEFYRKLIQSYMLRHKVKPGITGWAQINGFRGETDTLEKMEMRVKFDLEYIRRWSVYMDLKIILLTVFRVVWDEQAY